MLISPSRRILRENYPVYCPFDINRAHSVLCGFDGELAPIRKVLILSCADLRNVFTLSHNSCAEILHIHINDSSPSITARNILMLKIVSHPNFDPEDQKDMQYLWNVLYDCSWPDSTKTRFTKDVKELLKGGMAENACVAEQQEREKLEEIWRSWLLWLKIPVKTILDERTNYMTSEWNKGLKELFPSHSSKTFQESIVMIVDKVESLMTANGHFSPSAKKTINQELKHFFTTGNCGHSKSKLLFVNPTLLQELPHRWSIALTLWVFDGYLPFCPEKLDLTRDGILLRYCQKVMKDLLLGFRKRRETCQFFFYLCDPLELCLKSSINFDVIDTANLADNVGLANILNAARSKLCDQDSILWTESLSWPRVDPAIVRYLEVALCVSWSFIPTFYGLRLATHVELGSENPNCMEQLVLLPKRIQWQKCPGPIPLSLCPLLLDSLDELKRNCFVAKKLRDDGEDCGMWSFTPLTYHYIVYDLAHRIGGDWIDSAWIGIPPVFKETLKTFKTWMEGRPVLKMTARVNFLPEMQDIFKKIFVTPVFRLVLIPVIELPSIWNTILVPGKLEQLLFSNKIHFIDNFSLDLKKKVNGDIDWIDISFLIEDRRLIRTHSAVVLDMGTGLPLLETVTLSGCTSDIFENPYPLEKSTPSRVASSSSLKVKRCLETGGEFVFLLDISTPGNPSGLKVTTDDIFPCESAHQVTVSLDGIEPLTLTLPHPVLSGSIEATLRRKDRSVGLLLNKAMYEPWPAEFAIKRTKWNVEELPTWDLEGNPVDRHFDYQGGANYVQDPKCPAKQARAFIRSLFDQAVHRGVEFFTLQGEGSSGKPDLFLRAHLPIKKTPQGAPLLLLSFFDNRVSEKLKQQGRIDQNRVMEDFHRLFPLVDQPKSIIVHNELSIQFVRFVLRLNSTKIFPTRWQKDHFPTDGQNPLLATFVSPLYRDFSFDDKAMKDAMTPLVSRSDCAGCRKSGGELKRCGRCKSVSYCSVVCQRSDWPLHKLNCTT